MQTGRREHAETLYYHIAGDALKHAQKEEKEGDDEFRLGQYVCASMVFSAFTLEAYINQEYASLLGEIEVKQIDVINKWIMLPLLLGSAKTFKKGVPPCQTFAELISFRNSLVHFQGSLVSKPLNKMTTKTFAEVVQDVAKATKYFNCIAAMIKKLNELTSGQTSVPIFLKGERYLATSPFTVTMSGLIEFN